MTSHVPTPEMASEKNCQPDTEAAIDFLRRFAPEGPWVLSAIITDRGGIETRTFRPESEDVIKAWLAKYIGKRNLYFQVNPPVRDISKKAAKTDIKSLAWLHLDIDPRAGEDIEAERDRILGILTDQLPQDVPVPTCIIFSGGGYQAFWRLEEPIPVNGDLEQIAEAERYNKQLETLFGGDNCHNVDRIMRLPGTVNIPDERKLKKGRVPALARLEVFNDDCVYAIDHFVQASTDHGVTPANRNVPRLVSSDPDVTPRFLSSVDQLSEWDVPDLLQQLILYGKDPENLDKYPSRSEALFAVVCGLVRQKVPDDIIMGIQLDPTFDISESVLEKESKKVGYALRQLKKAKAAAAASWRDVDAKGNLKPSYSNARTAIEKLGVTCERNRFSDRKLVGGHNIEQFAGELSDDVCAILRQLVIEYFGFDPGKVNIQDAANALCIENEFDPVCGYLDGLRWDGIPRIETCLPVFFGAEDNELNRAISRKMFIAAVRRARQPGCKFDNIIVLEGKQGSGKSSALAILAGEDVFSDAEIIHLDARGQQEQIKGAWIYEIGELAGLRKADIERVKAFASRTHDRARPAYGRFSIDEPRRCIFVGTTNERKYLRDPTGNRRFWPVKTGKIDLTGIAEIRDQLWAEAAEAETTDEAITLPESLWQKAAEQQAARREDDPWLDILADVEGGSVGKEIRVSSRDLLANYLNIPVDRQGPHVAQRLADCMRRLGWSGPEKMRINGQSVRGFRRPPKNDEVSVEADLETAEELQEEIPF